jgi:hypothetical protein
MTSNISPTEILNCYFAELDKSTSLKEQIEKLNSLAPRIFEDFWSFIPPNQLFDFYQHVERIYSQIKKGDPQETIISNGVVA